MISPALECEPVFFSLWEQFMETPSPCGDFPGVWEDFWEEAGSEALLLTGQINSMEITEATLAPRAKWKSQQITTATHHVPSKLVATPFWTSTSRAEEAGRPTSCSTLRPPLPFPEGCRGASSRKEYVNEGSAPAPEGHLPLTAPLLALTEPITLFPKLRKTLEEEGGGVSKTAIPSDFWELSPQKLYYAPSTVVCPGDAVGRNWKHSVWATRRSGNDHCSPAQPHWNESPQTSPS